MKKIRLDVLLVERGLAESRSLAQRMVMAGQVRVDGQVVLKPSTAMNDDVHIDLETKPPFASRGGEKLEAAFNAFRIDASGRVCADVGASTGGFTDCLLKRGAARVYAIDVGKGILSWKLRQDPRVVVMEETNARFLEMLPEAVDLVTADVSFISLKIILPVVKGWFGVSSVALGGAKDKGEALVLVKPQFEAGRAESRRGAGVIRDPVVHRQVLVEVLSFVQGEGYGLKGLIRSPLLGPKGNREYLAWLGYPAYQDGDVADFVDRVLL